MIQPLIPSILWDDLYKFTMFQAVFNQFPRAIARYKVQDRQIDRGYPKDMDAMMRDQIQALGNLRMRDEEYNWLRTLRFSKPTCAEYMKNYRYNPDEVETYYDEPIVKERYKEVATIQGPWYRSIWWEVKMTLLTSCLRGHGLEKSADWIDLIDAKGQRMHDAQMNYIDYGTRRAFDMTTQAEVVQRFLQYYTNTPDKPGFRGTSNMFLAMTNDVTCFGTIAHEFYMAMQAAYGFRMANVKATEHWIREYDGDLGIALPDTLTTEVFLRDFNRLSAEAWRGVRLDSGYLLTSAVMCADKFRSFDIDPVSKLYVPSDSLTDIKAIQFRDSLQRILGNGTKVTAGIGTFFVNDCGYEPSSIVCKLDAIDIFGTGDFVEVCKLGDVAGKYSGNPKVIAEAVSTLRIGKHS